MGTRNGDVDAEELPHHVNPCLLNADAFKKKQKPLGHDFGKGATCRKCGDACPGLDLHYWRRICRECNCRAEDHDLPEEEEDPGLVRIGRLLAPSSLYSKAAGDGDDDDDGYEQNNNNIGTKGYVDERVEELRKKYSWLPPHAAAGLIERFMASLPPEHRPVSGELGEAWRREALMRQVPMHDIKQEACNHKMGDVEIDTMKKHLDDCREHITGQGQVVDTREWQRAESGAETDKQNVECRGCGGRLEEGEVAVFANRAGPNACWHPRCFVCATCKELLADLIYFYKEKDGNIYCCRHLNDSLMPRCSGCDELIFAGEYTAAEGKTYHTEHFCCLQCEKPLGGERYMVRDDNMYCLHCYDQHLARTCHTCNTKIGADVQRVSHSGLHWHATTQCFRCAQCLTALLGQGFYLKRNATFCGTECKAKFFAT